MLKALKNLLNNDATKFLEWIALIEDGGEETFEQVRALLGSEALLIRLPVGTSWNEPLRSAIRACKGRRVWVFPHDGVTEEEDGKEVRWGRKVVRFQRIPQESVAVKDSN